MDVWRITVATLRRWYIFLPLLALAGWAALSAGDRIDPEYQVSAQFVLTPGTEQAEIASPYGSDSQAATALSIILSSPATQADMVDAGLAPNYTVTATDRSSIMSVSVTSRDLDVAANTAEALIEIARNDLESRQTNAGIPARQQLGLEVLAPPAATAVIYDGKTQIQAVVGVLGAAVALIITLVFDDLVRMARRRIRRRKDAREARVNGDSSGEEGPTVGDAAGPTLARSSAEASAEMDSPSDRMLRERT